MARGLERGKNHRRRGFRPSWWFANRGAPPAKTYPPISERREGEHEKLALERKAWSSDPFAGVEGSGVGRERRRFRVFGRDAQGRIRFRRYCLPPDWSSEWSA